MPKKSYIINGDKKNNFPSIPGYIKISDNGDETEFYYKDDQYPTFVSKKAEKYVWRPFVKDESIPNLGRVLFNGNLSTDEATRQIKSQTKNIFDKLRNGNGGQIDYYQKLFPNRPLPQGLTKSAIAPQKPGADGTKPQTDADNPDVPSPIDTTNEDTKGAELTILAEKFQIESIKARSEYPIHIFPKDLRNIKEVDYIKFTQFKYTTRDIKLLEIEERKFTDKDKLPGGVYLPIQNVSDTNVVAWQENSMNPLQAAGAAFGLNLMESDASNIANTVESGYKEFIDKLQESGKSELIPAFKLWAAGQGVGLNNNLISRTSGAIFNNNLELLFSAPQLRSFSFNYNLSPRDETEANTVRGIIRFFKEGMAVNRTQSNLFLKTPNVFSVEYKNVRYDRRTNKKLPERDHPSLNKIKNPCALTNFQTNYAPDGSYMTFSDDYSTMTSYSISMTFMELEPLYSTDYYDNKKSLIPEDHIGY